MKNGTPTACVLLLPTILRSTRGFIWRLPIVGRGLQRGLVRVEILGSAKEEHVRFWGYARAGGGIRNEAYGVASSWANRGPHSVPTLSSE
jgi:hypothetical protein